MTATGHWTRIAAVAALGLYLTPSLPASVPRDDFAGAFAIIQIEEAAFAKLEAWTGVKPLPPIVEKRILDVPQRRIPPVLIRLLAKRR